MKFARITPRFRHFLLSPLLSGTVAAVTVASFTPERTSAHPLPEGDSDDPSYELASRHRIAPGARREAEAARDAGGSDGALSPEVRHASVQERSEGTNVRASYQDRDAGSDERAYERAYEAAYANARSGRVSARSGAQDLQPK